MAEITYTASAFYPLPSVKNAHTKIRVLKYACSVKDNTKQTSTNKILYVYAYFYTLIRKYGCSVKAALVFFICFRIFLLSINNVNIRDLMN